MNRHLGIKAALLIAAAARVRRRARSRAEDRPESPLRGNAADSPRTKDFTGVPRQDLHRGRDRRAQVARPEGGGEVRRRDRRLADALRPGTRDARRRRGVQDARGARADDRLHEADDPDGGGRRQGPRRAQDQAAVALTVPRRRGPRVGCRSRDLPEAVQGDVRVRRPRDPEALRALRRPAICRRR